MTPGPRLQLFHLQVAPLGFLGSVSDAMVTLDSALRLTL